MKITAVETTLFEPSWDDPLPGRYRRTHAAIRVLTDQGLVGNSRTWGPGVQVLQEYLAPAIVGEDPRNTERLWEKMTRVPREVPHVVELTPLEGGRTQLTVTERGYTSREARDVSQGGLEQTLDKLQALFGDRP
jgi:hypothetical protein